MIRRERCLIESSTKNSYGDLVWTVRGINVPCEMVPISSAERNQQGVLITTTYLFVTRSTIIPADQSNWRITWRGRAFSITGTIEQHYLRGRLHHRECVVTRITV